MRTSGDYPNYSIVKIGWNSKSSGDLRILAVTQSPGENYHLTIVCKPFKREADNKNKISSHLMYFAVSTDIIVKVEKGEKLHE